MCWDESFFIVCFINRDWLERIRHIWRELDGEKEFEDPKKTENEDKQRMKRDYISTKVSWNEKVIDLCEVCVNM